MIQSLMVFQFPLLFLPMFFIGLSNYDYNSDFNSTSSWIYLFALLLFIWPFIFEKIVLKVDGNKLKQVLFVIQIVCGVLVFKPMFMGFWDERSEQQAILLLLLAWSSLSISVLYSLSFDIDCDLSFKSLIVVVVIWLINYQFMMIVFLFLSFIALLGLVLEDKRLKPTSRRLPVKYKLFLVLASAHWAFVFLDYSVDAYFSILNAYLFLGLLIGVVMSFYRIINSHFINWLGLLNFCLVIYSDSWFLMVVHVVILGVWLGFLLASFLQANRINLFSGMVFLGFFLGVVFYKNLAYQGYILLFALPLFVSVLYKPRLNS
ncbi:MAG: hypothetical protein ISR69_11925 [Gammaproteobacteria bacterium]|nr:hypothetical protein [Gammaproteobacteria bacterium]